MSDIEKLILDYESKSKQENEKMAREIEKSIHSINFRLDFYKRTNEFKKGSKNEK